MTISKKVLLGIESSSECFSSPPRLSWTGLSRLRVLALWSGRDDDPTIEKLDAESPEPDPDKSERPSELLSMPMFVPRLAANSL